MEKILASLDPIGNPRFEEDKEVIVAINKSKQENDEAMKKIQQEEEEVKVSIEKSL